MQMLISDTYESFTFFVEHESHDATVLENYVFTIFEEGDYLQMLVRYPLLETANGLKYDAENAEIEFIDTDELLLKSHCSEKVYEIISWDETAGNCVEVLCTAGRYHSPGENCIWI